MEANERINRLFSKYISKTITETEFDELLIWLYGLDEEQSASLSESQKELWEKAKTGQLEHTADKVNWNQVLENVMESEKVMPTIQPVRRMWPRMAAAIILLLMLGGGAYMIFNKNKKTEVVENKPDVRKPENVLPNSNTTILTLVDGRQIKLDSAANGNLAEQGGTKVIKLQNGEIAYNSNRTSAEVQYNTITVPRGGRPYQLTMSDGTKVWLNVESSLRYPIAFSGSDRTVELTGEGYFEVAPHPRPLSSGGEGGKMPFIVKYKDMSVEVLGTHFDVMAYEDEDAIRTTLIEGSVKVLRSAQDDKGVVIKPGQQSILNRANSNLSVAPANTDMAIAWVKGFFDFGKQTDVKTLLRQVGRWYDLEIEFQGKVPEDMFGGKIERNLPLSGIIRLLDEAKIKIRVEGKKLIVQ